MQYCSKIVSCNRSKATGNGIQACIGDYEAQAMCPEWGIVIALEKIGGLITDRITKTALDETQTVCRFYDEKTVCPLCHEIIDIDQCMQKRQI